MALMPRLSGADDAYIQRDIYAFLKRANLLLLSCVIETYLEPLWNRPKPSRTTRKFGENVAQGTAQHPLLGNSTMERDARVTTGRGETSAIGRVLDRLWSTTNRTGQVGLMRLQTPESMTCLK